MCATLGLVELAPGWSFTGVTGPVNTGMVFSVASVTAPAALPAASSVTQTPYPGILRALSVQLNSAVVSGSATVTVTVNGVASALAGVLTNTSEVSALFEPEAPIQFDAHDTIGLNMAYTALGYTGASFNATAQVLVQYMPKADV